MRGVIKTLTDRGFGFIKCDDKKDIFFHLKELKGVQYDDLKVGDKVSFDVEQGQKGDHAVNVELV